MTHKNPPRIAHWMMEHLRPAGSDEALAGDLLEEFRSGRSAGWYSLQVAAALVTQWSRSLWQHRASLLFAAIWSFISPAWQLLFTRFYRHSSFIGAVWRIPWPWSFISVLILSIAVSTLFIWLGVSVDLVTCRIALASCLSGDSGLAFLSSTVAYAAACTFVIAITLFAIPPAYRPVVDVRTLTLIGVVRNFSIWAAFMRFPYFVGTAGALCFLSSNVAAPSRLAD